MPMARMQLENSFAIIVSLVNLAVMVFGGFIFLMGVKTNQKVQSVLLENLSEAVHRLDRTVEALRRGDGWITKPMHHSVDREYP